MAEEIQEMSGLTVVPASEIFDKVRKGEPVEYDHAIIKGNLDIHQYQLLDSCIEGVGNNLNPSDLLKETHRVRSTIKITYSQIEGNINFTNTIFECEIKLLETQIKGKTLFSETRFAEDAFFNGSIFIKEADFTEVQFKKQAIFSGSQFNKFASFSRSQFDDNAIFTQSKFKAYVFFTSSMFCGLTSFFESKFEEKLSFRGANFALMATFKNSEFIGRADFLCGFNGGADFEGARFIRDVRFGSSFKEIASFRKALFIENADFKFSCFGGNADFIETQFNGDADFIGSTFNGDANFAYAKLNGRAYFESVSFNNHAIFDESKTYFVDLRAKFTEGSRISLKHSDFHKLEVHWKDIKDKLEYNGSAYLALVKNYNNLEWFDDADDCYYHYRSIKRKEHIKGIIPKSLDHIAWLAYGYGVHPGYPLALIITLFLISIPIFALWAETYEPVNQEIVVNSTIRAFYMSATVLTSNPQSDILTGYYRLWGVVMRIAGWLLMASFLVALAKKTLR